jgi:hypothetical protein
MKLVNEVLEKLKGNGNSSRILTGKGSFWKQHFGDLFHALLNDTTHKTTRFVNGKEESINLSELYRADIKKTIANAKYPGKTELGVIDSSEICTDGLAEAYPYAIREYIQTGRKFTIPAQKNMVGDIYLSNVAGKTKTVPVRDIKTKQPLGSTTITTQDSIHVRAKSPVPKHLQTKVRKDLQGNVVKK